MVNKKMTTSFIQLNQGTAQDNVSSGPGEFHPGEKSILRDDAGAIIVHKCFARAERGRRSHILPPASMGYRR